MRDRAEALSILHEGAFIPAIPLALNADREFDVRRQRAVVRYYLNAGAGGIAVAVHTTQFDIRRPDIGLLEPVLRVTAEEIAAYEKKSRRTVVRVAGVCGPAEQAVSEARLAGSLEYDAVLLSPSGLGGLTEREMAERTRSVAAEMPVIGFYLQSAVGGRRFSFDYWRALADIPHVVALKCAPFDRYRTLDLVRGCAFSNRSDQVALYTGNDDNMVVDLLTRYSFREGGREVTARFAGGLLGHWSVWTRASVRLFERLKRCRGREEIPGELLTLAAQITDCNGAFFDAANGFAGCIPGVHEVLRRQGLLDGVWCLNPNEALSPGQSEEIDRVYRMYPHLNDDEFVRQNIADWQR